MYRIFFILDFSHLIAIILFFIGIFGIVFNYRNIIITFLSIELSLLSINLLFIFSSIFLNDIMGLIFSLIILTVAAAEAAIGLALLILFYKVRSTISLDGRLYLRN